MSIKADFQQPSAWSTFYSIRFFSSESSNSIQVFRLSTSSNMLGGHFSFPDPHL